MLKEINTTNPIDHIPYQNRWGRWVWRRPDIPEDRNWPGLKAPSKTVHPEVRDGKWCWVENDEIAVSPEQDEQEVLDYWTEENMKEAKPLPMPSPEE